ncbi:lytic transglycosylase domain-containing protein [Ideonella sp.]|uniref:lytic transglycosylase domain-containing protein n=1 Tax=Ideonella sp. TaxID=1929293 RepID=UPI002B479452|nr:transglycosylase SLT domain-containing protein [Ideonella sp.]HJV71781.1 transglycosylase SLT domain-containing protein [Ideonella sp.]
MLRSPLARAAAVCRAALVGAVLACALAPLAAQDRDDPIRAAREAFGKKDKLRLATLRAQVLEAKHPLAPWVDYWELNTRLTEARVDEVEAFYRRWPGSYVEDRLRNDWLLELGHRRDWENFSRDLPRFRMNDDREVACYARVAEFLAPNAGPQAAASQAAGALVLPSPELRDAGKRAWMAQTLPDEGCQLLAQTFYDARLITGDEVLRKLRHATEHNRVKLARQTAALLGEPAAKAVGELFDNPARYLAAKASNIGHLRMELASLALARMAANDTDTTARLLDDRWAAELGAEHGGWAWAQLAKQAAMALKPEAVDYSRKAWDALAKRDRAQPDWSDETLGWMARAALRSQRDGAERWRLAQRAIDAMSATERNDPAWQYWRARALQALAKPGEAGDAARAEARQALLGLSDQLHFYGLLAAEDLGSPQALPARGTPPSEPERVAARALPGLQRALAMIDAGLRSEGVREWNFTLIGMSDRELLAAAQIACEREVWDRCINTSERTKAEVDIDQRFPLPMRSDVLAKAKDIDLDPAYVYGLIRQESRFVMSARSAVGASGLMQIMPATARWTARKLGLDFKPAMLSDRDTNLKLGTAYLKLVLDDAGGSQPMAAAAYNAGPNRPRRWREGPVLEPAIWAENIPFNETRDYVKKVLTNATVYASLMSGKPASLKARLGAPIGPRTASAPPLDPELP